MPTTGAAQLTNNWIEKTSKEVNTQKYVDRLAVAIGRMAESFINGREDYKEVDDPLIDAFMIRERFLPYDATDAYLGEENFNPWVVRLYQDGTDLRIVFMAEKYLTDVEHSPMTVCVQSFREWRRQYTKTTSDADDCWIGGYTHIQQAMTDCFRNAFRLWYDNDANQDQVRFYDQMVAFESQL